MHKDDCIWTEPNRCNCGWLQDIAKNPCEAVREIERLRAELAECKQDAERYRHLLRHHIRSDPDMSGRHHWMTLGRGIGRGATAGEAIDAARKGEGE